MKKDKYNNVCSTVVTYVTNLVRFNSWLGLTPKLNQITKPVSKLNRIPPQ